MFGPFVAGEDVGARRALDLLDAGFDVAGVAAGDVGVEDGAADRRLDEDAAVVDAGEGGAVVVAGAAVEEVAVAGLAADQEVVAGAAEHRRRAAVLARVEDVDAVEDVVAAAAFERVGDVIVAGVERVVAVPPRRVSEPVPPSMVDETLAGTLGSTAKVSSPAPSEAWIEEIAPCR